MANPPQQPPAPNDMGDLGELYLAIGAVAEQLKVTAETELGNYGAASLKMIDKQSMLIALSGMQVSSRDKLFSALSVRKAKDLKSQSGLIVIKLRAASVRTQRIAAAEISRPTWEALVEYALELSLRWFVDEEATAAAVSHIVSKTSVDLTRLAIAAHCLGDVLAPSAMVSLLSTPLVIDEWQRGRAAVAAAALEAMDSLLPIAAALEDADPPTVSGGSGPENDDAVETENSSTGQSLENFSSSSDAVAVASIRSQLDKLATSHERALQAANGIMEALESGRPPTDTDLGQCSAFASLFTDIADQLHGLTDRGPYESRDEFEQAIGLMVSEIDASEKIASMRARLLLVASLPEAHTLATIYAVARSRALQILSTTDEAWSAQDRLDADDLARIGAAIESDGAQELSPIDSSESVGNFAGTWALAKSNVLPRANGAMASETVTNAVREPEDNDPGTKENLEGAADSLLDHGDDISANGGGVKASAIDGQGKTSGGTEGDSGAPAIEKIDQGEVKAEAASSRLTDDKLRLESAGGTHTDSGQAVPDDRNQVEPDESQSLGAEALVVAEFLGRRQLGLAYWAARTIGMPSDFTLLLAALAYSDKMRGPSGECASELRVLLETLDTSTALATPAMRMLALSVGVSGSIFSPYSGAAGLLQAAAPAFDAQVQLSEFIESTIEAAARGALFEGDVAMRARTLTSIDSGLSDVVKRAEEFVQTPKSFGYAPATDVWRTWMRSDSPLGELLALIKDDEESKTDRVKELILIHRHRGEIDRLIDSTHLSVSRGRGRARTKIEARARDALRQQALQVLDLGEEWLGFVAARRASQRTARDSTWQQGAFDGLRTAATNLQEALPDIVAKWCDTSDQLDSATGRAAGAVLTGLVQMLATGEPLPGREPSARLALGGDLLRAPMVPLSADLTPTGVLTVADVQHAALSDSWEVSFRERIAIEDFGAAREIILIISEADSELAQKLDREWSDARDLGNLECERLFESVLTRLDSARRLGHIGDDIWTKEYSRISQLDVKTTLSVGAANDVLGSVLSELTRYRDDAVSLAQIQLQALEISDPALKSRIVRLLEEGDIATFEEISLAVERKLEVPEPTSYPELIEDFFPRVVDQLANGVPTIADLEEAIENGSEAGACDFSGISPELQDDVVSGLSAWSDFAARDYANIPSKLTQILTVLGFSVDENVNLQSGTGKGQSARGGWRSATFGARPRGRALIPAFGSDAGGKYRLLVTFDLVADDVLLDKVKNEPGQGPLLVLHIGVMSSSVRRRFAEQVRRSYRKPIALVDTASFLFICSNGGGFETFMRVTLPFTGENPYTPYVAGSVPPEMFYGRKDELESVIDPRGTSFIYGGRRLGKSALLRAAVRRVAAQSDEHHAIYLDLKAHGIGESSPAGGLYEVLAAEFRERELGVEFGVQAHSHEILEVIRGWLAANEERRILLLLDEADEFLNADALNGFQIVRRIKDLMEQTNRRFKPVFAGLHQVQRFQSIPNQPLAHLGKPIAIGPLPPQYAFDLVASPLHALGYRFESDEILFRILTNTNYQPNLIQLLCDALLKQMNERVLGDGAPPYKISMDDVERVYNQDDLRREIQGRFEQTINLDQRYRIIAFVLALTLKGSETALPATRIRKSCEEWWPIGFENTTDDEFRALLDELVSLGILYAENGRYMMRSPNVVRMLGTSENLEERLLEAASMQPAPKFEAATFRAAISEDHNSRSPLTAQQTSELLRSESGVRVVFGSMATDVGQVVDAVCKSAIRGNSHVVDLTQGAFGESLENALDDVPAGSHKILVCKFGPGPAEDDAILVRKAAAVMAAFKDRTCSVVFVADTSRMSIWRDVLVDEELALNASPIVLRRWTRAGLRSWARDPDVDLPFDDDAVLDKVFLTTGGWPHLVNHFVDLYGVHRNLGASLKDLDSQLGQPDGAEEFIRQVGLSSDPDVAKAWKMLIDYGEPLTRAELAQLVGSRGAVESVEILRSIQLCEVDDDGNLVPEEVARKAWATIQKPQ